MAYKNIQNYFSFADIAIETNADNNRSLLFLRKIDTRIDWKPAENIGVRSSFFTLLSFFQSLRTLVETLMLLLLLPTLHLSQFVPFTRSFC